jgi:uncharacterized phage protein (TIGR01671 family)
MEREIKFRTWVYGRERMYEVAGFAFGDEVGDVEILDEESGEYMCYNSKKKECEVMQYTGLKDKNGKEIYEGDIVKRVNGVYDWPEIEVIEFYNGNIAKGCSPFIETGMSGWQSAEGDDCEVIGNIYENPNLIEYNK